MATNQIDVRSKTAITPEDMPKRSIIIGTANGRIIAPAIGVSATNQRNIL
ncbi:MULTISPECIES: hypothetical protein [Prochlorococcus]|nr:MULTISPECIES: hypothetical protein [Prochlorococcus]